MRKKVSNDEKLFYFLCYNSAQEVLDDSKYNYGYLQLNNGDKVSDNLKKILILVGICLGVLGLIVILFINSMKSELTGRWNSITTEDDCFSSISFTDGPPSTRVISISETNGNHTQVWMGNYKEQGCL